MVGSHLCLAHCHLDWPPPWLRCSHSWPSRPFSSKQTRSLASPVRRWWVICQFVPNFISLTHSSIPYLGIYPQWKQAQMCQKKIGRLGQPVSKITNCSRVYKISPLGWAQSIFLIRSKQPISAKQEAACSSQYCVAHLQMHEEGRSHVKCSHNNKIKLYNLKGGAGQRGPSLSK